MHGLRVDAEKQRAEELGVGRETHGPDITRSFPDAESAENLPEQILGVGTAHDIADGVERAAQLLGDEFRGEAVGKGFAGRVEVTRAGFQARCVAGIDRERPVAVRGGAAEDARFDGAGQRIETGVVQAATRDSLPCCRRTRSST